MFDHTNRFDKPASNGTRTATVTYVHFGRNRNTGELIMNRIQKAAAAAIALTITALGAAFVTAPMALADMQPAASHQAVSVAYAQPASSTRAPASRRG